MNQTKIKINGRIIDVPTDFAMEVEDSSPVFNDRGSQSLPCTAPLTPRNMRLLRYPHRVDCTTDTVKAMPVCEVYSGAYFRRGKVNITSAGKNDGISFNVGFDESTAYSTWSKKKLCQLSNLPYKGYGNRSTLMAYIDNLYRTSRPQIDDLAVFPIVINKQTKDVSGHTFEYYEIMNMPSAGGVMASREKVIRQIDDTNTEVSVPENYGFSPFVRVWKVVELVFADLGYAVPWNPFKEDVELARLVVLNNAADTLCTGAIRYKELMPDVTVETFLHSLRVRFGFVYTLDYTNKRANLRLLRDVLETATVFDTQKYVAGLPLVTYNSPQYLKLSAKTSFDGAEPATERFEDFARGYDLTKVRFGVNVPEWSFNPTTNDFDPDWPDDNNPFDDNPDWWDADPEYPDPDYPYDYDPDDGDYDLFSAPLISEQNEDDSDEISMMSGNNLAYEVRTGLWYKLDKYNMKVQEASTSFFNWDPQTPDHEAFELESEDEWVALERAFVSNEWESYEGLTPMYLAGARHYHTYVVQGNGDEDATETPLAFMFAFTDSSEGKYVTVGRFSGDTENGYVDFSDGSEHRLSLCFQFNNGLFVNFWRRYDEILRHGNRSIEVDMMLPKYRLLAIDFLSPALFSATRCLFDMLNYALLPSKELPVTCTLRTIETQGVYDIRKEQNVPPFTPGLRHLVWALKEEDINDVAASHDTLVACYDEWNRRHPDEWMGIAIFESRAEVSSIIRTGLTWETDSKYSGKASINTNAKSQYTADVLFKIYDQIGYSGDVLDEITIPITYTVILTGKWVAS